MTTFRMDKATIAHYNSFEDLARAWGRKPVSRKSKDEKKLNKDKEKFLNNHICPSCKKPMDWNRDTNICSCTNDACKGIKVEKFDRESGEKQISYIPSFHLLDEIGATIAQNILS